MYAWHDEMKMLENLFLVFPWGYFHHTCQLSLFNRNCPYFDPRKRVKTELFDHVFLFLQKSVYSNVYEIQECPYF